MSENNTVYTCRVQARGESERDDEDSSGCVVIPAGYRQGTRYRLDEVASVT